MMTKLFAGADDESGRRCSTMKAALLSPVASPSRYCADHFAGRIIGGVARRRNRVWV